MSSETSPSVTSSSVPSPLRVRVEPATDPGRGYDVVIEAGALGRLGGLLREAAPASRYVLITDANVERAHGAAVLGVLRGAGLRAEALVVAAGEVEKNRERWTELTDRMLEMGVGRDGCVLALGGGVVGDLAGFVAATYLRGVPVVQIPTTVLAMVDASVGGKTGVDTGAGKNLVGAVHQPSLVVADPLTLGTLPERELRSGLAEAVKHGAIADRAYFDWIADAAAALAGGDVEALTRLVATSVRIKAGVVSRDPLERGERKALNFGHTIAHAVEALSGFALPHGYAVAIGMVTEARVGERAGVTEAGTAAELERVLGRLGLPVAVPREIASESILERALLDKKARAGRARYALLAELGRIARDAGGDASIEVEDGVVLEALRERPAEV